MKFRQGFVSNSSTTSFCICGICSSESDLEDWLKVKNSDEEDEDYEFYDIIEECCEKEDLSLHMEPYNNFYYIGIDMKVMKDNETLGDIKNRVKEKLKNLFGDNISKKNIGVIVDGWRDG